MELLQRVDGKKTYIVGGLTILYGVIGLFIEQIGWDEALNLILAGLAMLGFRSALNK